MEEKSILIVEDDPILREALKETAQLNGLSVYCASHGKEALAMIENIAPFLILSDGKMDIMDGYALLKSVKERYPDLPFIMMTAFGSISEAVYALQLGASDYLTKPFEPGQLMKKIRQFIPRQALKQDPIRVDKISKQVFFLAQKVAKTEATVLIMGDSGAGKEGMARFIHEHSLRKDKPFIAINCAAIPKDMLEAILFGYEKGAFTGALKSMPGKFEQAQGGTLLLDEITEMDLNLQAKLLRVLQEKEVERIGGEGLIRLDVRILATTNRDLKTAVVNGVFREDLYYRINVFPIKLAPLRERKEDIIPLAEYLIEKHHDMRSGPLPFFSDEAKLALFNYDWPGNVREMENVIQRALILRNNTQIEARDCLLSESIQNMISIEETPLKSLQADLKNTESRLIIDAISQGEGTRKDIAQMLGISERTLRYKLSHLRKQGYEV